MEKKNLNLLKIIPIYANDGKTVLFNDFYYTFISCSNDSTMKEIEKQITFTDNKYITPIGDDVKKIRDTNLYTIYIRLCDLLGINAKIKDMEARNNVFKGPLLKEQSIRYKTLASLVVNFCGLILTHLYWLKLPNQRYEDEDDLLNFILRIGEMLMKEVDMMVAKQYNLVSIVESELKKTENVIDKRKTKNK